MAWIGTDVVGQGMAVARLQEKAGNERGSDPKAYECHYQRLGLFFCGY